MANAIRTALLLINPYSRSGQEANASAKQLLENNGFECLVPLQGEDFLESIEKHAARVELIIVGGGDGTLNYLATSLLATGITVGIIPLGTANDLSRTLGIPDELEAAIDVLVNGAKKPINVGLVNGKPFFNVANIGFGVEVNRSLDKGLKKKWGPLSYFIAAAKAVFVYRPFRVYLTAGSHTLKTYAMHVAVGNGCFYGGGLRVHKEADITENNLYTYIIKSSYLFKLIIHGKRFLEGEFEDMHGVKVLSEPELVIKTKRGKTIYADGEEITKTPAKFSILPNALEFMVPQVEAEDVDRLPGKKGER